MRFDYSGLKPGHYDLIYQRRRGLQSKWHHQKFARVRELLGPYERHLDVACGPGTFIGTLGGPGESIGIDIASPQIEYALANYASQNHRFQVTSNGEIPFPDAHFDVVTMIEFIEHLTAEETANMMEETRRVLRPGGKLVVTTPNYGALWPLLEFCVDRFGAICYQHQHISKYRMGSLRQMLSKAGFRVDAVETFLFLAPFAAALGWELADTVERLEPAAVRKRLGHLILAVMER